MKTTVIKSQAGLLSSNRVLKRAFLLSSSTNVRSSLRRAKKSGRVEKVCGHFRTVRLSALRTERDTSGAFVFCKPSRLQAAGARVLDTPVPSAPTPDVVAATRT